MQCVLKVQFINSIDLQCCPGYVNTDMTSHKGPLTIDQGADTPVWLATLPTDATSPAGQFCFERTVIEW
jgi:carbonyl reductase 1